MLKLCRQDELFVSSCLRASRHVVIFTLVLTTVLLAMTTPNPTAVRIAAKGWATRAARNLQTVLEKANPPATLVELNDAVGEFDKRLNSLDAAQEAVELTLDPNELEADINIAGAFRDKIRVFRISATQRIVSLSASGNGDDNASVSSTSVEARLPKLHLPNFSGNVTDWTAFWEQFEVAVDNTDLPDVTKFTYLRTLLKGEAKQAVAGLSLTAAHYKTACDILKQRYGRSERIIFCHVQDLLNLDIPSHCKIPALWKMFDDLQAHVRSLSALGITGEQYGVILTPVVLSRLPPELRMEWARVGEGHEGDLDFLLEFLRGEIECRERSQTFVKDGPVSKVKPVPVSTAAALHTTTGNRASGTSTACPLCGRSGHAIDRCFDLTRAPINDRKSILRRVRACFKCLSTVRSHNYTKCSARCTACNGRHHVTLCEASPNQSPPSVGQTASQPQQSARPANSSPPSPPSDSVRNSGAPVGNLTAPASPSNVSRVSTVSAVPAQVLLQTAKVNVHGKCGQVEAVVLFDSGADRTYISESLVNKIGPEWVGSQNLAYATFGRPEITGVQNRNLYNVTLQGGTGAASVVAAEMPTICPPMLGPSVPPSVLASFGRDIEFVHVSEGQEVNIDMLIGLDVYWKLMTPDIVSAQGMVAQRSIFGWILSGPLPQSVQPDPVDSNVYVSHQMFCSSVCPVSDASLKTLWDLESIGIGRTEVPVVDPVFSEFQRTVEFQNGRYVVGLPWKPESERPTLLNNEKLARVRLEKLSCKLSKDAELDSAYHNVICEMQREGIISEVPLDHVSPSNRVFYMPHRPVVKVGSLTTKVRPVFDASAKGFNNVSLNDCLQTGPNMIPDLPGVLLRFRRWKVALTADVTKAFLQIEVRHEDQDVHRFLWNDCGVIRHMRFNRVPFGNKSSPFLLNATVSHHLSQCRPSRAVEELSENLYVDDFLSGDDDDQGCCDLLQESAAIMDQGGFPLNKFGSNSGQVDDVLCREFQDKLVVEGPQKVLGLKWSSAEDCFSFDGVVVPVDLCITKRVVLSVISRLFDPLGFLTPFVMTAKVLFQDLWKLGLSWDEVVPSDLAVRFKQWQDGLACVRDWKIPRSYTGGVPWRDVIQCQLQAFGDASECGYGACVYVHMQLPDGTWCASLVMARARVAPLKRMSLPRLELLGALLCARLVVYVRKSLKLPEDTVCHCWTDSQVALSWICSDASKWKPFVGNRVAEVQELTSPSQWHHCPGKDNPADLVTRGISAQQLVDSQSWLQGPAFLHQGGDPMMVSSSQSPVTDQSSVSVDDMAAVEAMSRVNMVSVINVLLDCTRWSSLNKAIRVVGWVCRFLANARAPVSQRQSGELSFQELCEAKVVLLQTVQKQEFAEEITSLAAGQAVSNRSVLYKLSPFLDDKGILRVQGRLQFSGLPYDSRHPVIVPKGHLGLLLARHCHKVTKHSGVNSMLVNLRDQYWIIGARRTCKRVKKECVSCQRLDQPASSQSTAPLPSLRVTPAPPFGVTGLDHGGPLFCCDCVGKKFYILLFTCAVVRAVHLELVESLSCESTVLALRRFIARRGMPSILMSDNAKGFVAARDHVLEVFGSEGPDWRFIVPRAPWWGGWWERLIGSVKSALKKSLGRKSLTRIELETTLHEVEACVNSRPLTFTGDDVESSAPLTPAHFLLGRSPGSKSEADVQDTSVGAKDLSERHMLRCQSLNRFWSCWSEEYIRGLPPFRGAQGDKVPIQEGAVVLVRDAACSRLKWPLGIIQKIYPGRDGCVRTVEVKTSRGVLTRPIQHVHELEVAQSPVEIRNGEGTVIDSQGASATEKNDSADTQVTCDIPSSTDVTDMQITESALGDSAAALSPSVSDQPLTTAVQQTRAGRKVKPRQRLDL